MRPDWANGRFVTAPPRGVGREPAVVLGLNPNALASIRALARAGVPVVAIGPVPDGPHDLHGWMAARTRLAHRVVVAREDWPTALAEVMLACAPAWQGRGVVMPSGDAEVEVLVAQRARLEAAYHIALPGDELVVRFADKAAFSRFAAQRGVPSPQTLVDLTPEALAAAAPGLRYPVIVKPATRDAAWDLRFHNQKALACADAPALLAAFAEARASHPQLVVQEVVPGGDEQLVFSHVYVGRDGRELALWTGHKVRQLPIHFGTSTLAATRWDAEVAELTRRLLVDAGFHGYASVEFKTDPRDGSRRALEVTVGRTWYPHGLGVAAGVNLPLVWYRDQVGLPHLAPPPQRDGVLWLDEVRDLYAALGYRRAGELTWGAWLRSLRGRLALAHVAWDDPLPGLFVALRLLFGVATAFRHVVPWRGARRPG